MTLDGKKVAILIAPRGTEDPEFAKPKAALQQAGAELTVIGLTTDDAKTVNNDLDPASTYPVDKAIGDVTAAEFDALVVPGGTVGADKLRASDEVVGLVRDFFDAGKPVAAICHAPWVLIEAGVVSGRTLTGFSSIETDVQNAGGTFVDQEVVTDQGLTTSRNPDDLPAFCDTIVEQFAQARTPQAADA